ncbi:MAG: hypothetical protein LC623_00380 [Halobacteriales archaeon]|nr:hypothetical protein [Halobacteriales archaeon]
MTRWLAGLLLVALLPPAAAHAEQDAALLRPDVLRAGHAPDAVEPHRQWTGFLVLRPGHNVTAAQYQICRVGQACFAPPSPATRVGNDTFAFDTADYKANGKPVDYQPGWRIGVQWVLTEGAGNATRQSLFPQGPGPGDPACAGDAAALACQEQHYLAFDMAPVAKESPAQGVALPVAALLALGVAGRARRRHA